MKFQRSKFTRVVGTVCAASVASSLCLPTASSKAATSNTAMLPSIYFLLNSKNKAKTPNFITIVLDDMGHSDFGYLGGEIPTPHIDDLANNGIKLTSFYAAPVSTPSRAMLFTGKDNHKAGIGNMRRSYSGQEGQPGYEGYLNLYSTPFPQILHDNGYYTMITGKWDLGGDKLEETVDDLTKLYPFNRGFDTTRALLIPGGDTHYSDMSGDVPAGTIKSSQLPSKAEAIGRTSLYNENGQEMKKFPRDFYSTDYYTDMAIEMLDSRDKSKPFSLNLMYIAPHTPLQAPADLTARYMDSNYDPNNPYDPNDDPDDSKPKYNYAVGWETVLENRFTKMKELGILPPDAAVPSKPDNIPAWNDLTPLEKDIETKRMAIYAAMIDKIDQNIGRLVQHLKDIGEYENTVIFVHSDNGAETGAAALGQAARAEYIRQNFDQSYENMGNWNSYIGMSRGWARVQSAPYSGYKACTYEGGIQTAAFVHYPQAKTNGTAYDCITSVTDIAPTILAMAGINYPEDIQGDSIANVFDSLPTCRDRSLGWEIDGTKGLRMDKTITAEDGTTTTKKWKLSMTWGEGEVYYFFDLAQDIYEREELSERDGQRFDIWNAYLDYATKNGVVSVGNAILPDDSGEITVESLKEMSNEEIDRVLIRPEALAQPALESGQEDTDKVE
ncbi:MAG: hypothetical protein D3921_10645 [Candidatus Electrothrix sp. AW1]|nr:hypothetical protein [Candidatus Electrothrix sp. AX1]MCI5182950.1 hypothetical protein [Candidatus Electrothrix gigas]